MGEVWEPGVGRRNVEWMGVVGFVVGGGLGVADSTMWCGGTHGRRTQETVLPIKAGATKYPQVS